MVRLQKALLHNVLSTSTDTLTPASFPVLFPVIAVLSLVVFLCASHVISRKSEKRKGDVGFDLAEKIFAKMRGDIAKMVSWRKIQAEEDGLEEVVEEKDEGGSGGGGDGEVWRKRIMMGERCRPLEFSGKITYDYEGNLQYQSKS